MTRLVDDLDGSDGAVTVSFSLDGCSFEIDLSAEHLAEFRAVVAPFVAVARRVPQGPVAQSAADGAEPAVPVAESGVRPAVRGRGPRAGGRAAPGGSGVAGDRATAVAASMSEQPTVVAEVAADALSAPGSERKGTPLVVNPFSQEVRLI